MTGLRERGQPILRELLGQAREVGLHSRRAGECRIGLEHDTLHGLFVDHADDLTIEATGPGGAAVDFAAPTATDVVSGSLTASCSATPGSTFALGTTTVSCDATDAANNTTTKTFDVTVQDTTAPAVTAPVDLDIEAPTGADALVTFDATVTDAVTSGLTAACSPASGTRFALGTTSVTCTATDDAGIVQTPGVTRAAGAQREGVCAQG